MSNFKKKLQLFNKKRLNFRTKVVNSRKRLTLIRFILVANWTI